MSENLSIIRFRNGDLVPEAKTIEEWTIAQKKGEPAWCYYNNDPINGLKFGKLYNWHAVNDPRGLAPLGWHIPSDIEWSNLTKFLSGKNIDGKKMKSETGWIENGNGTNESNFSGLPGSLRGHDGIFNDGIGQLGYWWSSTEDLPSNNAWVRGLGYFLDASDRSYNHKGTGMSVRCIKD